VTAAASSGCFVIAANGVPVAIAISKEWVVIRRFSQASISETAACLPPTRSTSGDAPTLRGAGFVKPNARICNRQFGHLSVGFVFGAL